MKKLLTVLSVILFFSGIALSQEHKKDDHDHDHTEQHDHDHDHDHADHSDHAHHDDDHGCGHHEGPYNPSEVALHHISDANIYNVSFFVKEWNLPLPCFFYTKDKGFQVFSSGKFKAGHHGMGKYAYDGFALEYGRAKRITDPSFPMGQVPVCLEHKKEMVDGKEKEVSYAVHNDKWYKLEANSIFDGGLVGGGITSWYDFSITKNVLTMILMALLLGWAFISMARAYGRREGEAPRGLQGFLEPLFLFIQDDVAKPMIGESKYLKYTPYLMAIFFFILSLNLVGQIPFFGNPNVTGNISFTIVLAVFTFLVVNLSGNKHYWQHILNMPGIPALVKVIITPIEILGLFLKPFTLLVRLFANITAGHIVILSFVGLIFLLGDSGKNVGAGWGGVAASTLLVLFMSAIELLVAFIQAYIFTILSASYIGSAVEEAHDHH